MAGKNLFVSVPSFFKCPISMDVMKSPVSLCTGVTYDRSSIQKWLDGGHNTCPATMQVLPSTDFVPNQTLHRLILRWSDESPSPSSSVCFSSQTRALSLVRSLESDGRDNQLSCLTKIIAFAEESEENRRCFAKIDGFVPAVAGVLSSAGDDYEVSELTLKALGLTASEVEIRGRLLKFIRESDCLLSSIVSILRFCGSSSESKIEAAKVLGAMACCDAESKRAIAGREGLLYELCRLLGSDSSSNPNVAEAGLSALIALTASRAVKTELVRFGIVRVVAEILRDSRTASASALEKALRLLATVSTCSEGRAMICEDPSCVEAVVQRLLIKASSAAATEHALVVVWSLCCLFRDRAVQEAVVRNNGPTKILVLMQSNCSPSVRQMCNDLLKVFRVNSKSCLAGYETRTTHIMPF